MIDKENAACLIQGQDGVGGIGHQRAPLGFRLLQRVIQSVSFGVFFVQDGMCMLQFGGTGSDSGFEVFV